MATAARHQPHAGHFGPRLVAATEPQPQRRGVSRRLACPPFWNLRREPPRTSGRREARGKCASRRMCQTPTSLPYVYTVCTRTWRTHVSVYVLLYVRTQATRCATGNCRWARGGASPVRLRDDTSADVKRGEARRGGCGGRAARRCRTNAAKTDLGGRTRTRLSCGAASTLPTSLQQRLGGMDPRSSTGRTRQRRWTACWEVSGT